ncbi:MAG TPA: BrxA/BrxB family bacilliredoxin [Terriglobales bacterium]|jgi:putative YphP/YqiW family bacilliredoxin|nr:BrxA/BrxB family bacilliredoxin [Terriglobales bacterium]
MYPELMLIPMREELTRAGVEELRAAAEVDAVLGRAEGTVLVVVNSVCGCAAGRMRPAVRMATEYEVQPDRKVSVFAGQDREATERARSYFAEYPPSSPSIALLRNGELVFMLQRSDIEGREAEDIAEDLKTAFNRYCKVSRSAAV